MQESGNVKEWMYSFCLLTRASEVESIQEFVAERLEESQDAYDLFIGSQWVGSIPKHIVVYWSASEIPADD